MLLIKCRTIYKIISNYDGSFLLIITHISLDSPAATDTLMGFHCTDMTLSFNIVMSSVIDRHDLKQSNFLFTTSNSHLVCSKYSWG